MGRQRKTVVLVIACLGLALIVAGAASAAAGVPEDEASAASETGLPPSAGTCSATPDSQPSEEDEVAGEDLTPVEPPQGTETTVEVPFGLIVSGLRQAGDHAPAATIVGKGVPGWDPAKHSQQATTTATTPGPDSDSNTGPPPDTSDSLGDDSPAPTGGKSGDADGSTENKDKNKTKDKTNGSSADHGNGTAHGNPH